MEKVHNFLYPQEGPQDVLDFLEFGKNLKFDDPPPSYLIWEKSEIGKILSFVNPPSEENT